MGKASGDWVMGGGGPGRLGDDRGSVGGHAKVGRRGEGRRWYKGGNSRRAVTAAMV
jgi:hypothetical protein